MDVDLESIVEARQDTTGTRWDAEFIIQSLPWRKRKIIEYQELTLI